MLLKQPRDQPRQGPTLLGDEDAGRGRQVWRQVHRQRRDGTSRPVPERPAAPEALGEIFSHPPDCAERISRLACKPANQLPSVHGCSAVQPGATATGQQPLCSSQDSGIWLRMTASHAYRLVATGLTAALLALPSACGDEEPEREPSAPLGNDDEMRPTADAGAGPPDRDAGPPTVDTPDSGTAAMRDADPGPGLSQDAGHAGPDASRDAGTPVVAQPDAGPGGPLCLQPGDLCSQGSCCAGAICVVDGNAQIEVCAAACTSGATCNSGCCAPVGATGSMACAPASYCIAPPPPPARIFLPTGCGTPELWAEDGTYLGVATANPVATDGVCNEVSRYGSTVSATSIFNTVGRYGSSVSSQSAYSTITSTPPAIICSTSDALVAYVTKSTLKLGSIDPDDLCARLEASQL